MSIHSGSSQAVHAFNSWRYKQDYCVNYYQKTLKRNEIFRVNGRAFSQISHVSMVRNQVRIPWEKSGYFSPAKNLDFLCSSNGSGSHLLPCYKGIAEKLVKVLC